MDNTDDPTFRLIGNQTYRAVPETTVAQVSPCTGCAFDTTRDGRSTCWLNDEGIEQLCHSEHGNIIWVEVSADELETGPASDWEPEPVVVPPRRTFQLREKLAIPGVVVMSDGRDLEVEFFVAYDTDVVRFKFPASLGTGFKAPDFFVRADATLHDAGDGVYTVKAYAAGGQELGHPVALAFFKMVPA